MTVVWVAVLIGAFGAGCGWLTFIWLGRNAYQQGRLDERREAQLTAAGYTASVPSAMWNPPDIPVGRHRGLNRKRPAPQGLVERHIVPTKEAAPHARTR